MQDQDPDKKEPDIEDFDDFEDFDDIEDLEDIAEDIKLEVSPDDIEANLDEESWEDFDEEIGASFDEEPPKIPGGIGGEKTFVQKHFRSIVIGVVALFGGLILLGLSGGSDAPKTQNTKDDPPVPAVADNANAPPMPTPIDTKTEQAETQNTARQPLTPLPDEQEMDGERLAGFDFSSMEKATAPEASDKKTTENNSGGMDGDLAKLQEEVTNRDIRELNVRKRGIEQKAEQPEQPLKIDAKLDSTDSQLNAKVADLEDQLQEADDKIDTLLATVKKLERKIDTMSKDQGRMKAGMQRPVEERAKTMPPQKAEDIWVLRSAQPQKAILLRKNTNDFKSVSPGDDIEGLGRITFIGQEKGQWIIRGTNGMIKQP